MRKIMVSLVLVVSMASAVQADTLYLKNGSVLKGIFIGFENGEFIIEITDGNQVKFTAARVLRLEIDRSTTGRRLRRDSSDTTSSTGTGSERWVNAAPFEVRLEDQWARSQVQVSRGQRVRVEASGTVTLENRVTVTPAGLRGKRDSDSPMPNEDDGALIAAIGEDFDSPSIFIGSSREFVADRDGILYFTVNHLRRSNPGGAFRVNVSVDRSAGSSTGRLSGQMQEGSEKTVTVPANQAWTDTGIDLEANTTVKIVAEGQIVISPNRRTGPDGDRSANASTVRYPIQGEGVGAVIAKIRSPTGRDSTFLFIGSRSQISTESNNYGRLFIGINDDYFRDNSGSYHVTIRW